MKSSPNQSILDTVGNTPIVRLNHLSPDGVTIYAKLEAFNPMGSVKDRLALGIIEDAERSGELKPGQTVVEATSGNTGIGLALVCAAKGYPLVVVMSESFSVERRRLMRFLGAKVVLTPAELKGTGMIRKAAELAETHGWFLCRQFENPANAGIHFDTTGAEIIDAFEDIGLDYWVSGFGTGGTLNGVSSRLKRDMPATKIIVCEPDNSPLLSSGIDQSRNADGTPKESHPNFRPHMMQGWSPDFISDLAGQAEANIDGFEMIDSGEAMRLSRELAMREGILTGVTGGATLAGALQLAKKCEPGSSILLMLPDTGERYLSTPLFADIGEEMDDDEKAISHSTPWAAFGQPPAEPEDDQVAASDNVVPFPEKPKSADDVIDGALGQGGQPVVVFGLAWCEYCWSVKKFLDAVDVDYDDIGIDLPVYNEGGMGKELRARLEAMSGVRTFPQVYVGGEFVGGCIDVFNEFGSGKLRERLGAAGVEMNAPDGLDPLVMLPSWMANRG